MGLGIRQKGEEGRWWRKEEEQGRDRSRDARTLLSGRTKMFWRCVVVTVTEGFKST